MFLFENRIPFWSKERMAGGIGSAGLLILCIFWSQHGATVFLLIGGTIALVQLVHYTWYWLHPPEDSSIQLSFDRLVWSSPYFPAKAATIPLNEIEGAWTTGGLEPGAVLRLSSGHEVLVPPRCLGSNPAALVRALAQANPEIRINTDAIDARRRPT